MAAMREHLGLAGGFLGQVRARPDAPALVWQGEEVSYRALYEAAGRERERLALLGLGPAEPVGVLAPKSPATIALVLACVLTGRPFLLPSPALADAQLADLFAQAGCRAVLAPQGTAERVLPDSGVASQPVPDGTTFMLTTSGSTGLPKIVPLGAAAVDRFTAWAGPAFGIGPGTGVLNHAPLNFDLCLLDVWTTLAHGGHVVLVDPDRGVRGGHLLGLLESGTVHVVQAVPMVHALVADAARRAGVRRLPAVRHLMVTGDAVPQRVLVQLPGLFPNARLHNIYGCTETNDSFVHEIDRDAVHRPVPIGRPVPGAAALVVDADGAVVEGPGAGELYVSTPFQSPGYLDRTRHRGAFTGHPAALRPAGEAPDGGAGSGADGGSDAGSDPEQADGAHVGADGGADAARAWFRTGDLVRRDAEGRLHLTGRRDHQVKVRGVAVNTAEVERVLLGHPAVLEAGVTARPDPLTGRSLVARVRRRPGAALNSLQLKQHCALGLPKAAVPSALTVVDGPLPKTSTGKVDRTALGRLSELPTAEGRTS
ncbi:acyl-CoA synthetase [Streptomyces sp. NHF165]|nr:acyl-CoA synthetase [Streptomyces sp. NHF165]